MLGPSHHLSELTARAPNRGPWCLQWAQSLGVVMPWEPERIETLALNLEDRAGTIMGWAALQAVILFLIGLGGLYYGLEPSQPWMAFLILPGGLFWVFSISIVVRAQAEADRLRLDAQWVRLGIVIEQNTRRTAEALELIIKKSAGSPPSSTTPHP